jgi:hypothetical protein
MGRDKDAPCDGARKTLTLVSTTGALAICVCEVALSSVAKSNGFQALPLLLRAACFCFSDGNWVSRAALASSMRFFWRSSFAAASDTCRAWSLLSEREEAMAMFTWLLPPLSDLLVAVSESKDVRIVYSAASPGFSVGVVLVVCVRDGVPSGRRLATREQAGCPV